MNFTKNQFNTWRWGGCKVIANVHTQVEFLDNWFRRHPLKNSNSLFSFEFCLAATFTNLFFYLFFFVPIILRSDSPVALLRLGPIYMKEGDPNLVPRVVGETIWERGWGDPSSKKHDSPALAEMNLI